MNLDYVLTFAFVSLAVYRMSVMVAHEHGPFDIFDHLRGEVPDNPHANFGRKKNAWQKLLSCPFCLSVWFGLAGAFVLPYDGVVWFGISALALSATATIMVKRWG